MKYITPPAIRYKDKNKDKGKSKEEKGKGCTVHMTTLCAQCSEDPSFCDNKKENKK